MKQATIFLSAACPSTDVHLARVMSAIKVSKPDTEFRFVGIGGPQMGHEGLETIGVDYHEFQYKPFFPFRNFYRLATENAMHPVHMYKRWINKKVLNKLDKQYFEIVQHYQPSAFLNFENEFFMIQFYKKLRESYRHFNRICPPTFQYGLTHKDQPQYGQKYVDHWFTRTPMKQSNWEKFTFPHTQVGPDGLYRAFRHLLSNSPQYKDLVQNDTIYLPGGEFFRFDDFLADRVNEQRKKYRQQQNIGDQELLIFVAGGNTSKEIPFCLKTVAEGISRFLKLDEMKNYPTDQIKIIVSVPEFVEHKDRTIKVINSIKWPAKVIQVQTESEKFSAIAASDIGLACNGQIVAECAAFQLPTIILDPKPTIQMYYTSLYNGIDNDLNIAYNGIVYPELVMSTIPNKIAYSLLEHYQDPKLRYFYAKQYAPILQKTLAKSESQVPQELANRFNSVQLTGYNSAYEVIANTVLKAAQVYDHIHSQSNFTTQQNENLRIEAMQSLGWAKGL
ncbi:unnamed protein product [Paramecium primaurelia]|uniref:lipid-A-disaccharide synthase n=1 Tax=Paramecium primaurelia TaxID=5886 RepID=A0A8S1PSJ7_PARPR|nr:unnamed protein product [Paramecium primaurelia]